MLITAFVINVGIALAMGMAIGLERQINQHPAGLRTNALVCVGAALFVSLTRLTGDHDSPTRIASYIVSGIGFLGGGVIIRDGLTVKGINTAATLWCSAAVGTLAGCGFPWHSLIGTLAILLVNLGLRPISHQIDLRRKTAVDVETVYELRVLCQEAQEGLIRTIVLRHMNAVQGMTVQKISIHEAEQDGMDAVVAEIYSVQRNDRALHDVMSRLNIEPSVRSVSWEKIQN